MFKTFITAAAFTVIALGVQAAPAPIDALSPASVSEFRTAITTSVAEETAYYCQWVTVYDYWGNWVTVWRCY